MFYEVNLSEEKGARMRFFEKLFGSVSNSDEKNDYARATLEFATSLEINTNNAKADSNNRRWVYWCRPCGLVEKTKNLVRVFAK